MSSCLGPCREEGVHSGTTPLKKLSDKQVSGELKVILGSFEWVGVGFHNPHVVQGSTVIIYMIVRV